jgi:hypothetical protein
MTDAQQSHLADIQMSFVKEHRAKFERGAEEHKTLLHKDFTASELLTMALEEVQDLVSYLYTLRDKLDGK